MSLSDRLAKLGAHADDVPDHDVALVKARDLVAGTVLVTCDDPGHFEIVGEVLTDAVVTGRSVRYTYGKRKSLEDSPTGKVFESDGVASLVLVQASSL